MPHLRRIKTALAHDPVRRDDRNPSGAVRAGTEVHLLLRVDNELRGSVFSASIELLDATNPDSGWHDLPMEGCDKGFTATIGTEGEPRVLFYRFRVSTDAGEFLFTNREDGISSSGCAIPLDGDRDVASMPKGFQLTVYDPNFEVPDWFPGSVMYQIFPDRFARGPAGILRDGVRVHEEHRWPIAIHEDWNEPPAWYDGYDPIDFFGGTFSGIESRLDYLSSLGVDVLYLNPICEARSNHRYDTGNYEVPDALLGSWEDFEHLVEAARKKGIRVVVDTVLSHTGASSKYFNIDGAYPTLGAAQSPDSPYREWYDFTPMENGVPYRCWWGDETLPEIREDDLSWQEYALAPDSGILSQWAGHGALGYRLDVADEIPDAVLELVAKAARDANSESVVIGEVWEDATTKESYGTRRTYALGRSLDSVMNYPLRAALIRYALGSDDARMLVTFLNMQKSNYPKPMYESLMNLLSSHDVERIRTVLSIGEEIRFRDRDEQLACVSGITNDADDRGAALQRMLAVIMYSLPGVPSLYYGDERGMQGGRDPFDRATFPWSGERADCGQDLTWFYKSIGALRNSTPALKVGNAAFYSYGKDVFAILRIPKEEHGRGDAILVVVNRSSSSQRFVFDLIDPSSGLGEGDIARILYADEHPRCILSTDGAGISEVTNAKCEHGIFEGQIETMQACVFNLGRGLNVPMPYGMGVMCHITSLPHVEGDDSGDACKPPNADGACTRTRGRIGKDSRRFIDLLADANVRYWQILPLNPADEHGSPYAGLSAFAGNLELLDDELLSDESLSSIDASDLSRFVSENREWLLPYATFASLKKLFGNAHWGSWDEPYRQWSYGLESDPKIEGEVQAEITRQYIFDREWNDLREYAHGKGIMIIGDMPIYVSADSADAWAHAAYFNIDDHGLILEQGGVPPDDLSEQGQLWGSPTYDWEELRSHSYDWWLSRFERAFKWYDFTRIDHFIGFSNYFAIPEGCQVREGEWKPGPGFELFERAFEKFGPLPLVAEDLGIITPQVRQLLARCGFSGMDVLQFDDGDPRYGWNAKPAKIAFSGTHDTQTLVGWLLDGYGLSSEDAHDEAARLMDEMASSSANIVIFPLQDILGLDDTARMNVPGTTNGNWEWQCEDSELERAMPRMRELASKRRKSHTPWL